MKRLISTLTGLMLLFLASGCCCDSCCCPCRAPCGGGCPAPCAAPMTGSIAPSGAMTSLPPTYYGTPVASAPIESLPTY